MSHDLFTFHMSPIERANQINQQYISDLRGRSGVVFQYLRDVVAPIHDRLIDQFERDRKSHPAIAALDHLGIVLREAEPEVRADIERRIVITPGMSDSERSKAEQRRMNAVKSNAGKVFERYVGYAIARALEGTGWAVWHLNSSAIPVFGFDPGESLRVTKVLGDQEVTVEIEGDLLIAKPEDPNGFVLLVSVKSSLKDRLHNVTMWNLVKEIATDAHMAAKLQLRAHYPEKMRRVLYCLVCSDIAEEQKDLERDPRAKIKFDVSLLDYAFAAVASEGDFLATEVGAEGRGADFFHRLSAIGHILTYIDSVRRDDGGVSAHAVINAIEAQHDTTLDA